MTKKNKKKAAFTVKQQRFIDFYDGNATEAARKAGYKQPKLSGYENITKHNILAAIKKRETERGNKNIATREERQEFWTRVFNGELTEPLITGRDGDGNKIVLEVPPKMSDRLKAPELLGRSEADFTYNIKVDPVKPLIIFGLLAQLSTCF